MGFNCGIVGLPNVGKSTLFNAMTAASKQKFHESGNVRVEGHEYVIKEGDIVHFRFNV